jgi:hypothetical protein
MKPTIKEYEQSFFNAIKKTRSIVAITNVLCPPGDSNFEQDLFKIGEELFFNDNYLRFLEIEEKLTFNDYSSITYISRIHLSTIKDDIKKPLNRLRRKYKLKNINL